MLFNNWLTNPTSNDIRAPKIIRDRISLPWLSVPNQKTRLGASSETIRSASSTGWYGAIDGAKRAMRITIRVMKKPINRLGLFFNFRMVSFTRVFPLSVFYTGIYEGIKKVHRQIDNQENNNDNQNTSLGDRNIPLEDGIDQ